MRFIVLVFLLLFCFAGCDTYQMMLEEYNENFVVEVGAKGSPAIGEPGFVPEEMISKSLYTCAKGNVFTLEGPRNTKYSSVIYEWTLELNGNIAFMQSDRILKIAAFNSFETGVEYILKLKITTSGGGSYSDQASLVFYEKGNK